MGFHASQSLARSSQFVPEATLGGAAFEDALSEYQSTNSLSVAFRGTFSEESDMRNRNNNSGNSSSRLGGNFSAISPKPRAFRMTQREWRTDVSRAMHDHVGNRPGGAKVIAEEVECSPKTAQSWLDGESTPAGILDKRAMNRIPAYAALCREVAAMESDLDPRLQAKYQELHRLTLELAGGR